jgi:hypothetical protein
LKLKPKTEREREREREREEPPKRPWKKKTQLFTPINPKMNVATWW